MCPECSPADEDKNGESPDCSGSRSPASPEPAASSEASPPMDPVPAGSKIVDGPALLITQPDPRSFIYKYTLACFPILLVILCIFVRAFLAGATKTVISAIPGTFSMVVPAMTSIAGLSIFLIAPVMIFVIVAGIGWALRFTELWTSTAITLGLSVTVAFILMGGSGIPPLSERYLSLLLHWIAFLVQPFSLLAAVLILLWTEKFRKSLSYQIHTENIVIRGGVWKHQEHIIPHHQIARVVLEQDFFGRKYNYGTVIPQSISRWGAETSIRGVGAGGQKNNIGAMIGYAKGREEASRFPMDCFFGIPDPRAAQELMTSLMLRPASREEEQVEYLKQICDKI